MFLSLNDVHTSMETLGFAHHIKTLQLSEPNNSLSDAQRDFLREQIADLERGMHALNAFAAVGEDQDGRHNSLPQDCIPPSPSPLPHSPQITMEP